MPGINIETHCRQRRASCGILSNTFAAVSTPTRNLYASNLNWFMQVLGAADRFGCSQAAGGTRGGAQRLQNQPHQGEHPPGTQRPGQLPLLARKSTRKPSSLIYWATECLACQPSPQLLSIPFRTRCKNAAPVSPALSLEEILLFGM